MPPLNGVGVKGRIKGGYGKSHGLVVDQANY